MNKVDKEFIVENEDIGARLDAYLAKQPDNPSRSNIQKMIEANEITVNGMAKRANYKLRLADKIKMMYQEPTEIEILPENIPLDILYEDEDIIVINKARGMVVHPAPGVYTGTLVNALLYHCKDLSGINGKIRPGIVHRLDKDTSGVIVVAKNDFAHTNLAEQIGSKTAIKEYLALVHGVITEEKGIIKANIGRHPIDRKKMAVVASGGKPATTTFQVIERFKNCTYVKCRLLTGRTHQIRVHMAYIHHALIGDPKYCNSKNKFAIQGQALHSYRLTIIHPRTHEEMTFIAPLPDDMQKILRYFKNN